MGIVCGNCAQRHPSVDAVRACFAREYDDQDRQNEDVLAEQRVEDYADDRGARFELLDDAFPRY